MRLSWMAKSRLATLGFVLFVLSCASASAQRLTIVEENDVIAKSYNPALGFDQQHDWDYTQGFFAAVTYDDFEKDPIAGSVYDFLSGGIITAGAPAGATQQQMQVLFGQSIYTPHRVSDPVHLPGERPFGGWL